MMWKIKFHGPTTKCMRLYLALFVTWAAVATILHFNSYSYKYLLAVRDNYYDLDIIPAEAQNKISINYTCIHNSNWLPHPPTKSSTSTIESTKPPRNNRTILVVYSGPTYLINEDDLIVPPNSTFDDEFSEHRKGILYKRNFEHFLQYGIQCQTQDTVLVVTRTVENCYREKINKIHDRCYQEYRHHVWMVTRSPDCYDLETVRTVLHEEDVIPTSLDYYDYFVYVNCGMSGPSRKWSSLPWTDVFIDKLSDEVKLTGLTMNGLRYPVHIQSMLYATDRVGLQLLRNKANNTVIFNCRDPEEVKNCKAGAAGLRNFIVRRYEIGMSQLFLDHGYGISPIIKPVVVFRRNASAVSNNEMYGDRWFLQQMKSDFGRVLDLEHTIFFKTSRIASQATREELQLPFSRDITPNDI